MEFLKCNSYWGLRSVKNPSHKRRYEEEWKKEKNLAKVKLRKVQRVINGSFATLATLAEYGSKEYARLLKEEQ